MGTGGRQASAAAAAAAQGLGWERESIEWVKAMIRMDFRTKRRIAGWGKRFWMGDEFGPLWIYFLFYSIKIKTWQQLTEEPNEWRNFAERPFYL